MVPRYLVLLAFAPLVLFGGKSPNSDVSFELNRGQVASPVRYLARTPGGLIYLTDEGIVLHRTGSEDTVKIVFGGAPAKADWRGGDPLPGTISYYVGRDRARWADHVPRYRRLENRGFRKGVDLLFYGSDDRNLEYDLLLAPGVDPRSARMRIEGAKRMRIDSSGALVIETPNGGVIRQRKPVLYQNAPEGRRSVAGAFEIGPGGEVGLRVTGHDPSLGLSIDPVIEAGRYLGGSEDEKIVFAGSEESASGNTSSIDFPLASGRRRGRDVFIYSSGVTYIYGGSGDDEALTGNALVVAGVTESTDLPTELSRDPRSPFSGATQEQHGGGRTDGFFIYGTPSPFIQRAGITYIGGPGEDRLTAVTMNLNLGTYLAGTTDRGLITNTPPSPHPGGLDGFLAVWRGAGTWTHAGYFGGRGDDVPLAVAAPVFQGGVAVAGVTSSPDLVPGASIKGMSDAFAVNLESAANTLALRMTAGALFGGGGSDRITGLAYGEDGAIHFAGVTESPDFPTKAPFQQRCGGGNSDAFYLVTTSTLELTSATCFGGSGADGAMALTRFGMDTLIAGWTESADFFTRDAIQPAHAGGRDGFYLRVRDGEGQPRQSTYFGGSGNDEIVSLTARQSTGEPVIGGNTDSPSLPLGAREGGGGKDAFAARLSDGLLSAWRVMGARGWRSSGSVYAGGVRSGSDVSVTITSADPAKALLAGTQEEPGKPSITIPIEDILPSAFFYLDCLAQGETSLRASAPGFEEITIPTLCGEPGLFASFSGTQLAPGVNRYHMTPERPGEFRLSAVGVNPRTGRMESSVFPTPGGRLPRVRVISSNPAVAAVDPEEPDFNTLAFAGLTSVSPGEVEVRIETDLPVQPFSTFRIVNTATPLVPAAVTLLGGFQYPINLGGSFQPRTVTVTSSNPDAVTVSSRPDATGSASAVIEPSLSARAFLQARRPSGESVITVAAAGQPAFTTAVRIEPGAFSLNGGLPVRVKTSTLASLILYTGFPLSPFYFVNPDNMGLRVRVTSSNPEVIPSSELELKPGEVIPQFSFVPLRPGETTLTLSGDRIAIDGEARSVDVAVLDKQVRIDPVDLGKDTELSVSVVIANRFDGVQAGVTVTSEDPSLVLLNGQASVTVQAPVGTAAPLVTVQSVGGVGETRLRVEAPGFTTSFTTVRVGPVGWTWSFGDLNVQDSLPLLAYPQALDAITRFPLGRRSLRAGAASVAPVVRSSNPEVAVLSPFANGSANLSVKGPGETIISIEQPPGFTDPAVQGSARIRVAKGPLSLSFSRQAVLANMQASVGVHGLPSWAGPVTTTFTSSDPGKIMLSEVRDGPGSPSITVRGNSAFVQALGPEGSVSIKASVEGFGEARDRVLLAPLSAVATVNRSGPYPGSDSLGRARTTPQSDPTRISIALTSAPGVFADLTGFRPGAGPVTIGVRSSRPEVGTVEPSRITISDATRPVEVLFRPLALGQTEILLDLPAGFARQTGKTEFIVEAATISRPDILIARSTVAGARAEFQTFAPPRSTNLNVTITSTDPSRLLLSLDERSPATASISQVLTPNSFGLQFYLHALAGSGPVPVTITAPGMAESRFNAVLANLGIQPSISSTTLTPGSGRQGAGFSIFVDAPVQASSLERGFSMSLRPGAEVLVRAVSSDSAVVRVDRAEVTLTATSQGAIEFTPLAPGTASLSFEAPGYTIPPQARSIPITVNRDRLRFSFNGPNFVGHGTQLGLRLEAQPDTIVTVRSSDPSLALVSDRRDSPGEAEISFRHRLLTLGEILVQGLASTGTVTITATAEGYDPASIEVPLAPLAAVFGGANANLTVGGPAQSVSYSLMVLHPATLRPDYPAFLMPGVTMSTQVTVSDPSVLNVSPQTIRFPADFGTNVLSISGRAPGTAIVSIAPFPGHATAAVQRQLAFQVTQAPR